MLTAGTARVSFFAPRFQQAGSGQHHPHRLAKPGSIDQEELEVAAIYQRIEKLRQQLNSDVESFDKTVDERLQRLMNSPKGKDSTPPAGPAATTASSPTRG